jgi:Zc3h12a-like Ribonuclease NYN domain
VTKRQQLVVVDGSNLATEGRSIPSLRQLDEAVRAFMGEHPDYEVVVVVDATFEHRIAASERAQFNAAELAGEIVTPPAGAVGRGDAFILKIAKQSDAIVLSNDSFQEFHAEHAWLFEEGRLIGGKPVPRVGWVFTPRNPVRGPKSKAVTTKAARAAKATATAQPPAKQEAERPAQSARATPSKKTARPAAKKSTAKRAEKATSATVAPSKRAGTSAPRATAKADTRKAVAKTAAPRTRATKSAAPAAQPDAKARPEPVNTQRSFLRLQTDHPLGSSVDGEVVQFTSHGAMVSIAVGRTMHVVCYAPLAGLGSPTPTRARDVLKKGGAYTFKVVSFDATRRRAELALAARR